MLMANNPSGKGRGWPKLHSELFHQMNQPAWYLKSFNMWNWVGGGVANKVMARVLRRTLCKVFFPFGVSRAERA